MSNKKLLNESYMTAWASWNKTILRNLYGQDVVLTADITNLPPLKEEEEGPSGADNQLSFSIVGEEADVKAYAQTIMAQKNYLDFYVQYGLEHFQTKKAKEILEQKIHSFQQLTGITWPFSTEE